VQIDFLGTKGKRYSPFTKRDDFHSKDLLIEISSLLNACDSHNEVI